MLSFKQTTPTAPNPSSGDERLDPDLRFGESIQEAGEINVAGLTPSLGR
jgi:hypothetical protein